MSNSHLFHGNIYSPSVLCPSRIAESWLPWQRLIAYSALELRYVCVPAFRGYLPELTVHSTGRGGLNTGDNEESQVQPTRDSFSLFDEQTNKPKCSFPKNHLSKTDSFSNPCESPRLEHLLLEETLEITGPHFSSLYNETVDPEWPVMSSWSHSSLTTETEPDPCPGPLLPCIRPIL